jgi:predicted CopG family antitoxin
MRLKNISVSETNYHELREFGGAGQSFNDVISELIARVKKLESEQRPLNQAQTGHQSAQ